MSSSTNRIARRAGADHLAMGPSRAGRSASVAIGALRSPDGCGAIAAIIPKIGRDATGFGRPQCKENGSMRRIMLIAACLLCATTMAAAPALAGNGALARDDSSEKYGLSSNEDTQTKADDVAMKVCGSDKCKIVFRTGPKECGALASAEEGKAWGGAKRPRREAAELAAIQNCQKQTKGQCKIRGAECNR